MKPKDQLRTRHSPPSRIPLACLVELAGLRDPWPARRFYRLYIKTSAETNGGRLEETTPYPVLQNCYQQGLVDRVSHGMYTVNVHQLRKAIVGDEVMEDFLESALGEAS